MTYRLSIIFQLTCAIVLCVTAHGNVFASDDYEKYLEEYPSEGYIVGIGEVRSTGNRFSDKRVSDVLARREIAAQVRVNVSDVTVDMMCSGSNMDEKECSDTVISVVETSVNELLRGSRIVDSGVRDDTFFSVAVMPKANAVDSANLRFNEHLAMANEELKNARAGQGEALERARRHFDKARIYEIERQVLEGVSKNASKALNELELELRKLKEEGAERP